VLDAAARHTQQTVSVGIEASSGAVAQALAAAGRGIAVVTDDPRFDLARTKIIAGGDPMKLHLFAAWDPNHPAHSTLAAIAQRLAEHVDDHYGSST
jgi:DNA-binding transcriptional LysR family regulator